MLLVISFPREKFEEFRNVLQTMKLEIQKLLTRSGD